MWALPRGRDTRCTYASTFQRRVMRVTTADASTYAACAYADGRTYASPSGLDPRHAESRTVYRFGDFCPRVKIASNCSKNQNQHNQFKRLLQSPEIIQCIDLPHSSRSLCGSFGSLSFERAHEQQNTSRPQERVGRGGIGAQHDRDRVR